MGFIQDFFRSIWSILVGLWTTLKNMVFRGTVTMQYPNERWDAPQGYRGLPVLLSDEEGKLKCVACELCAKACPVNIISISSHKGEDKKKVLDEYFLDVSQCLFCGLCAEACPFEALAMSDIYELSSDDPNMIYDKEKLAELGRKVFTPEIKNYGVKTEPIHGTVNRTLGKARAKSRDDAADRTLGGDAA